LAIAACGFMACSDDTTSADSSMTPDAQKLDKGTVADKGQGKDAPLTTPDALKPDMSLPDQATPDANCVKPGATQGPPCTVTSDCHAANWQLCFLKCMGCGCICYDKRCYDLREFNCK